MIREEEGDGSWRGGYGVCFSNNLEIRRRG